MRDQRNGNENKHRFAERDPKCQQFASTQVAQRRQENRQDDHRQIFHQRDPDHDLPLLRLKFAAFSQKPRQHHRARDRDNRADRHSLLPTPSQQRADSNAQPQGQEDSQWPAHDRDPLHAQQIAEGEFQTDGIHQQDDSDLRQ